jgi:MFS family permease
MANVTQAEPKPSILLSRTWYWYYVLALLTICYVANVVDRSQVLAASLQAIKREFNATDTQLGILSGLPFAIFYSFLGIPLAAWADRSSRRNVLAWSCALWSAATGLCGMAVNFTMLFSARVFTAIGEAGGSPPSHSLISDYFPKLKRGTAFSIYALAVPVGTAIGAAVGARRFISSAFQASRSRCSYVLRLSSRLAAMRTTVDTRQRKPRRRRCAKCSRSCSAVHHSSISASPPPCTPSSGTRRACSTTRSSNGRTR